MNWVVNKPTLHRVVMDVLNFLFHHFMRADNFGMASFLPKLILLVGFSSLFEKLEFLQQSLVVQFFYRVDYLPCRVGFEFSNAFAKFGSHGNPVQMIFHNRVSNDVDLAFFLEKTPGVEDDLHKRWIGKNRETRDHRAGHALRPVRDLIWNSLPKFQFKNGNS